MSAPTNIRVTREHISVSLRGSWCDCPIALAIKDQWSGSPLTEVQVGQGEIHLTAADGSFFFAKLPDVADLFIHDFDAGAQDVKPFEFTPDWGQDDPEATS